jgi:hypothetical protein
MAWDCRREGVVLVPIAIVGAGENLTRSLGRLIINL